MFRMLFFGLKNIEEDKISKLTSKKIVFLISLILMGFALLIGISLIIVSSFNAFDYDAPHMENYDFWTIFSLIVFGQIIFTVSVYLFFYGQIKAFSPESKVLLFILVFLAVYYVLTIITIALILIAILINVDIFISFFVISLLLFTIYLWLFINLVSTVKRLF